MSKIVSFIFIFCVAELFLIRIYATIVKNKVMNRSAKCNEVVYNKKKTLFSVVKDYLSGLCFFTLRIIGFIPSFRVRTFLYKNIFLMKIGRGTKIRGFVEFSSPWNIEIGDNTMIGQECKLDGRNGLYIGNNVNISDCTAIWTEQHDINDIDFACNDKGGKVVIEDRVWLGFRSIVLPNVNIKEGAVLASGAVATKNLDAFSLYLGVPAIKKKERNNNINYNLDIDYVHFI